MSDFKKGEQPARENPAAAAEQDGPAQKEEMQKAAEEEKIQPGYTFDEYDAYTPWE